MTIRVPLPDCRTYTKDGRKHIRDVFEALDKLDDKLWNHEVLYWQQFTMKGKRYALPIIAFRTKQRGKALWIIGGIHGEEPAAPNAITDHIGFLNDIAQRIPVVLIPLCNPAGYVRDWRYPDAKRIPRDYDGSSVGNSEHLLPDLRKATRPRARKPVSEDADRLTEFALKTATKYQPQLVLDLHEDDSTRSLYIFSQGRKGANDPIAKEIVNLLVREGFNIRMKGVTKAGDKICDGVIGKLHDGSIDELLAAKRVFHDGSFRRGPHAKSVIVLETTSKRVPLARRIAVHREVLLLSERFFLAAAKETN